jgi:hypothetical protein
MALVVVRAGAPVYILKAPTTKVNGLMFMSVSFYLSAFHRKGLAAQWSFCYTRLSTLSILLGGQTLPCECFEHALKHLMHTPKHSCFSDLKVLDRFNEHCISVTVSPTMDILVMHASGAESKATPLADTVRRLVTKVSLNPLASLDAYIANAAFDAAVRSAASKLLGWDV